MSSRKKSSIANCIETTGTTAIVTGEHIAIRWLRDLSSMDKREKKGEK